MNKYDKNFAQWFAYDESSPTCLRWIVARIGRGGKPVKRRNDGIAGGMSHSGSVCVNIKGELFSVKKIIWTMVFGDIPEDSEIMFKDGDAFNCRIDNLYLATKQVFVIKYGPHLREYLEYDESSPSGLRWKKLYAKGSTVKIGDVAGSLDAKDGYWRVHALGTHLKAHKVVWALFNDVSQEGFQIDHKDGNRSNNNISNLRLVDKYTNQQNRSMNSNNSTGVAGVCYSERVQPNGEIFSKFTATVYHLAKKRSKTFSVQKFGHDKAFQLACDWRKQEIDKMNSEGLSAYTDRHGT